MKRLSYLLMLTLGAPLAVQAAEESPHTLTANIGLYSNYIFRGISQTGGEPAIQGGFDYAHSSGFYLGTWASNVGWLEDFQGYTSGNIEIDLYGGYRGSIGDTGVTFDVGAIQYFYPGDVPAGTPDADTTELYAALGWKWFTAKYYYAISDEVFGFGPPTAGRGDADGSGYLDISASVPIGETGLTIGAHWGTFSFEGTGNSVQDYDDWKISLAYDLGKASNKFSGMTIGVAYTDTDTKKGPGTPWRDFNGEDLGDGTTTVWISKAF